MVARWRFSKSNIHPLRRPAHRLIVILQIGFLLLVLGISATGYNLAKGGQSSPNVPQQDSGLKLATSGTQTPLLSLAEVNLTVSGIYSTAAANFSVNIGNWPAQSKVDSTIWTMYLTLNKSATFDALWKTWGISNFTFTFNGQASSGITNVTYGVQWEAASGAQVVTGPQAGSGSLNETQEYWVGVVSSGALTGPFNIVKTARTTTPYTTSTGSGPCCTKNYAGYTLDDYNSGPIRESNVQVSIPSFSNPFVKPGGPPPSWANVDPVGAVWTGIAPLPGGGGIGYGGLLQTGYTIDTNPTAGSPYGPQFIYEFLPFEANDLTYPGYSPTGGGPIVYPLGLQEDEQQIGQFGFCIGGVGCFSYLVWCTFLWDGSTGFWTIAYFLTTPNYKPYYGLAELEAYATQSNSLYINQLAEFSDADLQWLSWQDNNWEPISSLINNGYWSSGDMDQSTGGYTGAACTNTPLLLSAYTYPTYSIPWGQVDWSSSAFNWNCVYPP